MNKTIEHCKRITKYYFENFENYVDYFFERLEKEDFEKFVEQIDDIYSDFEYYFFDKIELFEIYDFVEKNKAYIECFLHRYSWEPDKYNKITYYDIFDPRGMYEIFYRFIFELICNRVKHVLDFDDLDGEEND